MGRQTKYRIGAVARMTGISAHALRAWERRYGKWEPSRSKGGGRLYNDGDVGRLRLIRQLLDRGHAIGQLVSTSAADLSRTLATHGAVLDPLDEPLPNVSSVSRRFVEAVICLDLVHADQLLARAAMTLDPMRLVLEVVVPIIERLCVRWERGELRGLHEHAATSLLKSLLSTLTRLYLPRAVKSVVVGTPRGEPCELGALTLAFVATVHHFRVLYLGSGLGSVDLLEAADRSNAESVLLSLESMATRGADEVVRELVAGLPRRVSVMVSGRGAEPLRARVGRARVVRNIAELEACLGAEALEEPIVQEKKCSM